MRYRALDSHGDMTLGQSQLNFLVNSPDAVAQAVQTRLLLLQGEWFLDITEGTPYATEILGEGTLDTYNDAIRQRILDTQGVTEIVDYSGSFNGVTRTISVSATIDTIYGAVTIQQVL